LHVNIFNNHPNNYGSLLDLLVPEALELLKVKSRKMKQTLPISISNLMGVAASENEDPKRGKFINAVKSLLNEVVKEATDMLDAGSDQLLKSFISNRLPIPMSSSEEERSAQGAPNARIYQYTKLRIVRPGVARAIIEYGKVIVYHCIYNDREHFKTVLSPLEYELDDGPAIEALLFSYPDGIIVEDLPHPSEEVDDKVSIAQSLYKEGLLIIEDETSVPSKINKDNESDEDDPF
jgi:lysine-specific demethylase/histidyl-hydroxylase NO66